MVVLEREQGIVGGGRHERDEPTTFGGRCTFGIDIAGRPGIFWTMKSALASLSSLVALIAACGGAGAELDNSATNDPGGGGAGGGSGGGATAGGKSGAAAQGGATSKGGTGGGFVSGGGSTGDAGMGGQAACAKTEAAATKVPIDVIVGVDQSGSMSDDIANVKANVNKLAAFLDKTKLDYRVVMMAKVGTATYDVCVPPPLGGASCASKPPIFRTSNQIVASTNVLSLFLSTFDVTTGDKRWNDVLRKEALKVFIPISDDNSALKGAEFDKQLLAKPGGQFGTAAKRNYVVYPVMGAPAFPMESPKCGSNAVNTGSEHIAVAKLTGGKWFPICLKDFGPVFEEIAKTAASKVACELGVPMPPAGSTLDPMKVNVVYTPGAGGAAETILQDPSKPCDMGANGWQFSADKTKILLCGATCTKVQADAAAEVKVEFGCETKVVVPE